jgi:hypothetical protein
MRIRWETAPAITRAVSKVKTPKVKQRGDYQFQLYLSYGAARKLCSSKKFPTMFWSGGGGVVVAGRGYTRKKRSMGQLVILSFFIYFLPFGVVARAR